MKRTCLSSSNSVRSTRRAPDTNCLLKSTSRSFNAGRETFQEQDLPSKPRDDYLEFKTRTASGPLDVLRELSEEGKALYTEALLDLDDTYKSWTMHHETRPHAYPEMDYMSPCLAPLIVYGRIRTEDGIAHLSHGMNDPPRNPAVLHKLLSHPKATLISQMFELRAEVDVPLEPIGADAPIPLVDVWPWIESASLIEASGPSASTV